MHITVYILVIIHYFLLHVIIHFWRKKCMIKRQYRYFSIYVSLVSTPMQIFTYVTFSPFPLWLKISAANRLIGEVVQSRRRPLLGPSPG